MLSKDFDFEKSIKELEKIAASLENEQITLDESIALFEKGVKLSKDCSEYLESAKQKIITLTEKESEDNG
ncbi:MAG: exodeoxyribonuclease VII small subunit [Clostridia bacterium]|nr:exodeoxyribonuclease VII small subunit [Clostridia bacterium]MBR3592031.1 exodeoxyribonuclease VII small subunit [Clostridia bacterium]